MQVERIRLDRTYAYGESEPHRAEDWATPLWEAVAATLEPTVSFSCLRDAEELTRVAKERLVNYAFSRLVVSGCHWLNTNEKSADSITLVDGMTEALRQVLEISDPGKENRIAYLMAKVCFRVHNNHAAVGKGQLKKVRKFATSEGHRCYICGRELHFAGARPFGNDEDHEIEKKRKHRSFTVEHMWSQERGGSRSRDNLAACCQQCNGIKSHLISYADYPIELIMTNATSEKSIKASVNNSHRFAILWRQGGCCNVCERLLYNIDEETIFLARREKAQPLHFLNMQIVCAGCNADHDMEGVCIRA